MSKRKARLPQDMETRREEILRPSRFLGYSHDQLGIYFIERHAFELAELELRRAIWLNPFEPTFKVHLALALQRQHRSEEARQIVQEVLNQHPNHAEALFVAQQIENDSGKVH